MALGMMALCFALAVPVLVVGCDGTERRPRHGTVTLNGEPLASGLIQYEPAEDDGLASGAAIKAGRYEIPGKGGLYPGRYCVRIQAVKEAPPPFSGGAPGDVFLPPGKDLIPARYNAAPELSVEIPLMGKAATILTSAATDPRSQRRERGRSLDMAVFARRYSMDNGSEADTRAMT